MDEASVSIISCFEDMSDPRVDRTKRHKLVDILVIAVCGVVAGCDSFEAIELFANAHEDWFKTFLGLPNGIPSQDTFERVFARINPSEFRKCFSDWSKGLAGVFANEIIAIDGQTLRGAKRTGESSSPVHLVSAWAVGLRLVLGQTKVDEKSNEITAIPEVLKLLELRGCIVTIDAMGCQQKIAQQIVDQSGDYVLGLKGNQGTTLEAVETHFATTSEAKHAVFQEVDKGHGRIETRTYYAAEAAQVLDLKDWPGIKSVVRVDAMREIGDQTLKESRYYISSIVDSEIARIGQAIRGHWGIENSLHHVLDVTFNQDGSRIRKDFAPENFAVLRHFALNILKSAPPAKKGSNGMKAKRTRAGYDMKYLKETLRLATRENTGI
jgi:predicted transposase YbfD/YdcC